MSFKDIKGQEMPIQILKEHIKQSRLGKAYLFCGPEGVGKKMTAKILAKAVNCLQSNFDSCDECVSCRKINKEQHPDVHIIDADDAEIKIETIRQLQNDINLRPYEARKKVFIINNAHNLNIASANAFLKTLEECIGENLIILISDKASLLPKTIISRCQIIKFSPLKREQVRQILLEDYVVAKNLSHFLAYFCEGRIGTALRLKESDILEQKNRLIDEFVLSKGRGKASLVMQKREEMRACLNILASWFRDIYILKIGMPHSELINLDRKSDLLKLTQGPSFSDLDATLNFISASLLNLERNVNIKLLQSNLREAITYGA